MATIATHGIGTLLKRGDGGSPETFTSIAQIMDVQAVALSRDTIEITNMSSPNSAKEYMASLIDGGELSIEAVWIADDAQQGGLRTDFIAGTVRNFKVVLPDPGATTQSFSAIVTKFEINSPVSDKIMLSASLKITGLPTES